MIVKKLTLINFFRYSGKQIIDFATENNHNVTVIRGENGTGKTTLLNAFYWALYGDVSEPLSVDNCELPVKMSLNKKAMGKARILQI